MISDEEDEVIIQTFCFNQKKCCEFVFDYVQLLYYKCHKINFNRGGSYIDSPYWKKIKKQQ